MAVGKKKNIALIKNEPIFDINDWIDTKNNSRLRSNAWSDSEIRYVLKKHDKKENYFWLTIHFKKKILLLMDNSKDPKIMVLQHKKDDSRILMTRSPNGYRVNQPSKHFTTYNIRCPIKMPGLSMEDKISNVIEPIFHEKGVSSGSIIEFKIEF